MLMLDTGIKYVDDCPLTPLLEVLLNNSLALRGRLVAPAIDFLWITWSAYLGHVALVIQINLSAHAVHDELHIWLVKSSV